MNERIKALADKASNDINMVGYHNIPDEFKQKFAELIIREYEQFLPNMCPWVKAEEEGPMKGWHVQFVAREHFGVK